ncbi:MAG: lipid A deacylase LpxR family protein, partial [Bacteroidota bacterium]
DQMEPSGQAETMFPGACSRDSLFISRLVHNRAMISGLDLNEPAMRNFLFFTGDTSCFPSMITLSRESFLRIGFDNDILDYTDRFYTNGIRFDIILPLFSRNPINRLLIPHRGSGNNYYGISLVQNMYTPSSTKTGGISYNDRPYAAYLYVGSFKVTNVAIHYFRQTSGLLLGIIGPGSYGGWVQRSFHNSVPTNNEPLGWEYQIKNDFLINYDVAIEKGVINKKHIDLRLISTAAAGSLYTNLSGGFQVRAGWMNPYFANLGMARTGELMKMQLRKFQCYLFIGGACKLIGYDATLQGGMFNRTSPYTLTADQISRAVFQSSAGITFNYRGFRLDIEQFILSPEFKKGWWHKWVHIGLAFCL